MSGIGSDMEPGLTIAISVVELVAMSLTDIFPVIVFGVPPSDPLIVYSIEIKVTAAAAFELVMVMSVLNHAPLIRTEVAEAEGVGVGLPPPI